MKRLKRKSETKNKNYTLMNYEGSCKSLKL